MYSRYIKTICLSILTVFVSNVIQLPGWGQKRIHAGTFKQDVRSDVKSPDDKQIDFIAVTEGGTLFAASKQQIYTYQDQEWNELDCPYDDPITAIACDNNSVWITKRQSLLHYQTDGNEFITIDFPSINQLEVSNQGVLLYSSKGVHQIKDNQINLIEIPSSLPIEEIETILISKDGSQFAVFGGGNLYIKGQNNGWSIIKPRDDKHRWSFQNSEVYFDFDRAGNLWFAMQQGVGFYQPDSGKWKLFSGEDGLPYNQFSCIHGGQDGSIWFGTDKGAIRYENGEWAYRYGRRWLFAGREGNTVLNIAVDGDGNAWILTEGGLGLIERRSMTLDEKAQVFERITNERHVRYGYVSSSVFQTPGDPNTVILTDSDNDGLWTAMYGAAECFRYAVTKDPEAKRLAKRSFEALKFLVEVTDIPGFPARSILPTSGPDPNAERYTPEKDRQRRETRDPLWKIISPRWPKSEDGKWYWKCDTSSDETDGHYFFYALYHDLVAETKEEKAEVVEVVRAITDHFMRNSYRLIDHDGKPTRWAIFNPENLNFNHHWWEERGLNSLSILSYLKTAEYMTGDEKYDQAAEELIRKHGYAQNTILTKITFPKESINHSDDEMAFMCFYNLLKYEDDPQRRYYYLTGLERSWEFEAPERSPLFNFIYGAVGETDRFGLADGVDTLKGMALDLIDWRMENSHRLDLINTVKQSSSYPERVIASGGGVLPIEERPFLRWNNNPYTLDGGNGGRTEQDGALYLLPYWMGRYHEFITVD